MLYRTKHGRQSAHVIFRGDVIVLNWKRRRQIFAHCGARGQGAPGAPKHRAAMHPAAKQLNASTMSQRTPNGVHIRKRSLQYGCRCVCVSHQQAFPSLIPFSFITTIHHPCTNTHTPTTNDIDGPRHRWKLLPTIGRNGKRGSWKIALCQRVKRFNI